MKYFKKLIGEKCFLSPLSIEDTTQYTEWLNDIDIAFNLNQFQNMMTLENERRFIENGNKSGEAVFAIITKNEEKLIGNCGLKSIDLINRSAEFGIFIGDKNNWDKGYGTEATNLILDYGFNILNLNNIYLFLFENNKRAYSCYKKLGFKETGRRRQGRLAAGKYEDIIFMDILAGEFKSVYIKDKLN